MVATTLPMRRRSTVSAVASPGKPPVLEKSNVPSARFLPLDTLVELTRARFPSDLIGYIQIPGRTDRPARIRLRLPDDPHPNGLTSVWLDPISGRIIRVDRWRELDPGARAVAVVYPLHIGMLGGGWLQAIIFLNGSTLCILGVTGVWTWWTRRGGRLLSSAPR